PIRPALVSLAEHHELTQDLAQISPIDFIDDEDIVAVGIRFSAFTEVMEGAVLQAKITVFGGAEALDEVLVGVRLMELHHLDTAIIALAHQRVGEPLRDKRFSDAGWAL